MKKQSGIQQKLAHFILSNRAKKLDRNKATQTLQNSKTALILFDALKKKDFAELKSFASWLGQSGISTNFIGYADQKESFETTAINDQELIFNLKDCSWLCLPKNENVSKHLKKQHDLLFDFNIDQKFPAYCCSVLANSNFKAGSYQQESNHLDFMIDIGSEPSIRNLTNQLKQYFGQLKR